MVRNILYQDNFARQVTADANILDVQVSDVVAGSSIFLTAGEAISAGDPCYIDSATGKVFRAVAGNIAKMPATLVAAGSAASNTFGRFISVGSVSGLSFAAADVGKAVYVGSTGGLTTVVPSAATNLVQQVGVIRNVATLLVDIKRPDYRYFVDNLTLVATNNPLSIVTTAPTLLTATQYDRDKYKFFGHSYSVLAIVDASTDSGGGVVRFYNATNNVILGDIIIPAFSDHQVVTANLTANMPASGVIRLEVLAKAAFAMESIVVYSAVVRTVVGG